MLPETDPSQELHALVASLRFALEEELEIGVEELLLPGPPTTSTAEQPEMTELLATVPPEQIQDPRMLLDMEALHEDALGCERCPLHETRQTVVFGVGSHEADLVFVGEAPGADEDRQGEPFVGRAGQLLTNIIRAIDLARDEVYILNVLKCRPPGNRNPKPFEIEQCRPFLERQLQCLQPKVICALGTFAAQILLDTTTPISRLRGRFHDYHEILLMPTYHPAFLLRNPGAKRQVWEDVQQIQERLKRG